MLPAHLQELLTASVDGELTAAERRLTDKFLRDSAEARVFHAQIVDHAERLNRLPVAAPADDLASHILNLISDRAIMPTPLPTRRRKSGWNSQKLLPWISISAAACVLIAVGLSSYLYFAVSERQSANAAKNANAAATPSSTESGKHLAKVPNTIGNDPPSIKIDSVPKPIDPVVAKNTTPAPEELPSPRVYGEENIVTTPPQPEREPFKVVTIELQLILPLRDLDQAYPKQLLRDELKKDEIIRLELFAKDSTRAAELLQAALKTRGHHLVVDAVAQERLKKKQRTEYVFYTESLTSDEIAHFLEQLGTDDGKAESKKVGDGQFDKFVLARFVPSDLNELAKLLGVSAAQLKLPKLKTANAFDPRKPLEINTAAQLAAGLPKTRSSEKQALVLPYGSAHSNPQTSKEIKSFLEKRGERKPGTVPMMLVLRLIN